jgi:DNA adenine methylase
MLGLDGKISLVTMAHAIQATQLRMQDIADATPFLKWAGGKNQIFEQLRRFLPTEFENYFEGFVGSAAVFFNLRRLRGNFPATLSDRNAELINCYKAIRDELGELIPGLEAHKRNHDEKRYYRVREQDPGGLSSVERAARFIYLNKTCYNGLYRVNKSGKFNVPIGSYSNPSIFDEENLAAVSRVLRGVKVKVNDFSAALDSAKTNDFVYFDPPYYTEDSGFTSYAVSASGTASFGADEHRRLRNVVDKLSDRGCHVVVSNSDTDYVRRLYRGYRTHTVKARRYINCNGAGRHEVSELVITTE